MFVTRSSDEGVPQGLGGFLQARQALQLCALPSIVWSRLVLIMPFWLLAWLDEGAVGITTSLQATVLAYSLWTRLLQRHTGARPTPYSLMVRLVGLNTAMLVLGEQPSAGISSVRAW